MVLGRAGRVATTTTIVTTTETTPKMIITEHHDTPAQTIESHHGVDARVIVVDPRQMITVHDEGRVLTTESLFLHLADQDHPQEVIIKGHTMAAVSPLQWTLPGGDVTPHRHEGVFR